MKLHVWFVFLFLMYHEHLVGAVRGDTILLDHIAESQNVCDSLLVLPHVRVISCHLCLVGDHYYGSTITF